MTRHRNRLAFLAFVLALLASVGVVTLALRPASSDGPAKSDIERIVHSYIVEHPEVLQEAVAVLRERQGQEAAQRDRKLLAAHRKALYGDLGAVVTGNPNGDVTIIEFFDYNCPYCKEVFPTLERLQASDPDIRLVLREFPVLAPSSLTAARAALAAERQGLYVELHNALMSTPGRLTDEAIMDIARRIGLDMDRLRADMKDPAIDRAISANLNIAQQLGLSGTPSFVIGDSILRGLAGIEKFEALVKEARAGCETCVVAEQQPNGVSPDGASDEAG